MKKYPGILRQLYAWQEAEGETDKGLKLQHIYRRIRDAAEEKKVLSIKPFFRWYDFWIGWYFDKKNQALYIIPFPMCGIKITRE